MSQVEIVKAQVSRLLSSVNNKFFLLVGIGAIMLLLALVNMYFLTKPFPAGPECLADPNNECFVVSGHPVFYMISEAFVAFSLFAIAGLGSLLYLLKKDIKYDFIVVASAKTGILAAALTLLVGIFWSKVEWGLYWQWDSRQTMTLVMFIFYVGMILFRASVEDTNDKAKLTAVFGIVAFFTVPMTYFISSGLHPSQQSLSSGGNSFMGAIFMFIGTFLIYLAFLYMTVLLEDANNKIEEYKYNVLAKQE
ncbi:MAG: cytochrome c biogenesis protein CcsA [Candidatus Hodarchaeales archaeon]